MVTCGIIGYMTETTENHKDFYSVIEFAQKLQVHTNTIRRSIKNGRIMAFKFGTPKRSTYRIPHSEIQRLMLSDLRKCIKMDDTENVNRI